MSPYLRPMAPIAPAAILCGDPARALLIAQAILTEPRMSNHHRGLWGYHGRAPSGRQLTVQATGIGGASAAIVVGALARYGVRAIVRVGTCRAAGPSPEVGATVAIEGVVAADGACAGFGIETGATLHPDRDLTAGLRAGTDGAGTLFSVGRPDPDPDTVGPSALHDLQSAAVLAAAREHGIAAAVTVVVARNARGPLEDEPLEAAAVRLGRLAAGVLAGDPPTDAPVGSDLRPSSSSRA
jgi:nucleoside phosphorylase